MEYYIYILECADKSLYVGCTNNLERRFTQHNESKSGAHYTKIRRPVRLVYSEKLKTLKTILINRVTEQLGDPNLNASRLIMPWQI